MIRFLELYFAFCFWSVRVQATEALATLAAAGGAADDSKGLQEEEEEKEEAAAGRGEAARLLLKSVPVETLAMLADRVLVRTERDIVTARGFPVRHLSTRNARANTYGTHCVYI